MGPAHANDPELKPNHDAATAAPDVSTKDKASSKLVDGVPAEYFVLEPGDHELLAKLLQRYPALQQTILEHAARDLGNETVAKACEILHGAKPEPKKEEEAKPAPNKKEEDVLTLVMVLEPGDQQHLASLIRSHPGMQDKIIEEARKWLDEETIAKALELLGGHEGEKPATEAASGDAAPAAGAKPTHDRKNEPPWVTRARAFNKRNADYALMFNYATKWSTAVEGTEPDPYLVADWQAKHGISPDGRVGAKTAQKAVDLGEPATANDRIQEIAADLE
jgi:hypothetical protein